MNPGEYAVMARVEREHWWYQGLRGALASVLEHPRWALPPGAGVVDAGCGTGENLRFLAELLRPSYLGGFDASEEAVALARAKAPGADVYVGDICRPELHRQALDLVLSLDVIYIPGVRKSLDGLTRLVGALRPGGLMILNLPAYQWLYSEHDEAVHTSQRFTARDVRDLARRLGLVLELLSYRLCALFPLVVASRLPGMLRSRDPARPARSDLQQPPGPRVNRLLLGAMNLENACLARGLRFPWGSSVFAVARKP